jgi:hypothetical protein
MKSVAQIQFWTAVNEPRHWTLQILEPELANCTKQSFSNLFFNATAASTHFVPTIPHIAVTPAYGRRDTV